MHEPKIIASRIYNTIMIIYPELPLWHPVLQGFVLHVLLQAIITPPI